MRVSNEDEVDSLSDPVDSKRGRGGGGVCSSAAKSTEETVRYRSGWDRANGRFPHRTVSCRVAAHRLFLATVLYRPGGR